jgi:hypothetical protein
MKVTSKHLTTIGVAVFATTLSYAINYYLNLGPLNGGKLAGPVVAASLVGILGALFFKEYALASYIAAFAGMSSTTVIPSIWYAPLFGFMAGLFAILMARLFVGYGGRAGTMCFVAVNLTLLLLIVTLGVVGVTQHNISNHFRLLTANDLDPVWIVTAVVAGIFGTVGTVVFREKVLQKRKAPNEVVLGSAVVALVSALVLPWVLPSLAGKIAAVVASGTYAGMVSRKIMVADVHLAMAGAAVGLLNVLLATVFIGVGGRLGFMGLLGIALFHYLEVHGHKPAQLESSQQKPESRQ